MAGQFRLSIFDPILVIAQIITIQSLWYTSLGILVFVTDALHGSPPCLAHMFAYQDLTVNSTTGFFLIISYLVNSLCGAFYLWYVVKRAKPCLDYSATIHTLHLILSWFFTGSFPWSFSWWILNSICIGITCVCGEFLCMKTEMKSIPLLSKSEV